METQLQKYNGKNIYNNAVIIDFDKKTVDFNPIRVRSRTIKSIKRTYLTLHIGYFFYMTIISTVILAIIAIALGLLTEGVITNDIEKYTLLSWFQMVTIANYLALIISMVVTYTHSRITLKTTFPKRNADLMKTMFRLQTLGTQKIEKIKVVNPEAIIDNKWIIPMFSNVIMHYKATDDFAKNIKGVKIINHYQNEDEPFMAVFEFKKKPRNGKLTVQYI